MVLVIAGDPGDRPVVPYFYFLAEQDPEEICQ